MEDLIRGRKITQNTEISDLSGKSFDLDGIKVIPTYHPAFLLRNPERKRDVWEDMKKIAKLIRPTST